MKYLSLELNCVSKGLYLVIHAGITLPLIAILFQFNPSNKLIFSGQICLGQEKDCSANFQVYLDSGSGFAVTEEARGPDRNNRTRATTGQGYFLDINDEEYMIKMVPLHVVLDCDNTNQHSVKLYLNQPDVNNRTVYINRTHNDNNEAWIPSYTSHFTLMEVEMS